MIQTNVNAPPAPGFDAGLSIMLRPVEGPVSKKKNKLTKKVKKGIPGAKKKR